MTLSDLPVGAFIGTVHGRWRFMNRIWRGKTFDGNTVTNRILGHQLIEGQVTRQGGMVVIRYPQLFGLTDRLTAAPGVEDGSKWDGSMVLGPFVIYFSLEKPP